MIMALNNESAPTQTGGDLYLAKSNTKQLSVATFPRQFQAQPERGLECPIDVLAVRASPGAISVLDDVVA
jgi:hypothetical protein